MGKDEYFRSFRENADNFICSLLPGISGGHPQIQYSPGTSHLFLATMDGSYSVLYVVMCIYALNVSADPIPA